MNPGGRIIQMLAVDVRVEHLTRYPVSIAGGAGLSRVAVVHGVPAESRAAILGADEVTATSALSCVGTAVPRTTVPPEGAGAWVKPTVATASS